MKAAPNCRDACFELVEIKSSGGEGGASGGGGGGGGGGSDFIPLGYCSVGAYEYAGAGWPFTSARRPLDVAAVSRIVLLPHARGRGALPHALGACALFCRIGIPVRLMTRKREVAEKAMDKVPSVLRRDALHAKKMAKAESRRFRVTAMVPYVASRAETAIREVATATVSGAAAAAAAAAEGSKVGGSGLSEAKRFFQTHTPGAKQARGKNEGWVYWFVGQNVVHSETGEEFARCLNGAKWTKVIINS